MNFTPLQTEGIVLQGPTTGFEMMPVILDNMRPDELLVEMKYTGICHTVSSHKKPTIAIIAVQQNLTSL